MVLELGTTQDMDPLEAEAYLLDLQILSLVGRYDAVYLQKMKPRGVRMTPGQCWKLLLAFGLRTPFTIKGTPAA